MTRDFDPDDYGEPPAPPYTPPAAPRRSFPGAVVPGGVEPIKLAARCYHCGSFDAYNDTRTDKKFCARCGKTIR